MNKCNRDQRERREAKHADGRRQRRTVIPEGRPSSPTSIITHRDAEMTFTAESAATDQ